MWTAECEAGFKALKRVLVSAPVLDIADPSKSYMLQTDVSGRRLGAVLSQVGADGEEHPIVGTTGIPHVSIRHLIYCPDRSPTTVMAAQDESQHCTLDNRHYRYSVQDLICCPDRSPTTAQDEVQHCTLDKVGSVLTALLLLAGL